MHLHTSQLILLLKNDKKRFYSMAITDACVAILFDPAYQNITSRLREHEGAKKTLCKSTRVKFFHCERTA